MSDPPACGLWSLVALNSVMFIIFAFSFARPRTMVFGVRDAAMLSKVQVGSKVHFMAERVEGSLVASLAPQNRTAKS